VSSHLTHTASDKIVGFLFQFERMILRLTTLDSHGLVGIETDDDITVRIKDGEEFYDIYEQDKFSKASDPFKISRKELWNTILIWLKIAKNKPGNKQFYLVTNQKVSTQSFAHKISQAGDEKSVNECYKDFLIISKKAKGKRKEIIEEIQEYSESEIKAVFKAINLIDDSDQTFVSERVRDNLNLKNDPVYHLLFSDLLGWVYDQVTDKWKAGEAAFIEVRDFNEYYTNTLSKYLSKPFIEKAASLINIDPSNRIEYLEAIFVQKLRELVIDESLVLDAIDDFLRAKWEKSRFIQEFKLSKNDFQRFEAALIKRWKVIFEKLKLLHKGRDVIEVGALIYYQTIEHREKLGGFDTLEDYTTRGAYQKLSNKDKVIWKPT